VRPFNDGRTSAGQSGLDDAGRLDLAGEPFREQGALRDARLFVQKSGQK
jgi:hypothetical protein